MEERGSGQEGRHVQGKCTTPWTAYKVQGSPGSPLCSELPRTSFYLVAPGLVQVSLCSICNPRDLVSPSKASTPDVHTTANLLGRPSLRGVLHMILRDRHLQRGYYLGDVPVSIVSMPPLCMLHIDLETDNGGDCVCSDFTASRPQTTPTPTTTMVIFASEIPEFFLSTSLSLSLSA